ncbi:hypothetical protein K469DRAFT_125626 [Zopfia rhizophila CBS 207.26]|uniref:Uncharacterized protein n=1 Tax=Zopfia rhizophila CBS 207.26 TaxID=1314779 RepID=A0A6A6E858_9PEZI|nr:hypothetical protein K469DRAFT_125626 [Zopfia rhizophila CBS 207.26]
MNRRAHDGTFDTAISSIVVGGFTFLPTYLRQQHAGTYAKGLPRNALIDYGDTWPRTGLKAEKWFPNVRLVSVSSAEVILKSAPVS